MPHPQDLKQRRSQRARERAEWDALRREEQRVTIQEREQRCALRAAEAEAALLRAAQYRALRIPIEAEIDEVLRDQMIRAISKNIRDKVMAADVEV